MTVKDDFLDKTLSTGDVLPASYLAGIRELLDPLDRTAAEIAAGVTPVNYQYPPYDFPRYGSLTGTDDSTMFSNWLKAAAAADARATNSLGAVTVALNAITLSNSNSNVPQSVDLNGMRIVSRAGVTGSLITIENPHGANPQFRFIGGGASIDCDGVADYGLTVHGSQHCYYGGFKVINGASGGVRILGESGFGVYYNTFDGIQAGENGSSNAGDGFLEDGDGTGGSFFQASNTFINCRALFNQGRGWVIDFASNVHIGCEAEKNDLEGFAVDNAVSVDFFGGYSEANHQNFATDGASDVTTDTNFSATANTTGLRILGGRHIGTPSGTWSGQANWYMPGYVGVLTMPHLDALTGRLGVVELRCLTGGIGLNNATPASNTVNFANTETAALALSGTNYITMASSLITMRFPMFVNNTAARITAGTGTPEGAVTAAVGSLFLRTDGGASTTLYIKESGTGSTGWVAK